MRLLHHVCHLIRLANVMFAFIVWIPCLHATKASTWLNIHLTTGRSLLDEKQRGDNGPQVRELQSSTNVSVVNIAVLFDSTLTFAWAHEIVEFTFIMINDRTDGWHDDIFPDGTRIEYYLVDAGGCDETRATQAYWDARGIWNGTIHGVVGPRCSGATIAVGRIANLEDVPHVSPSSTSPKLSDKDDFPLFSRLCGPSSKDGEVGAMVSMLRSFGWDRVTILNMDTQYAKDYTTAFEELWKGEHLELGQEQWVGDVSYSSTITFNAEGKVDTDSVIQALEAVPTNDPNKNSRVILLVADVSEAYPILQVAGENGFQPDTIWVGSQSWVGRLPADVSMFDISQHPGYLGLTPFRNRDDQYHTFLERIQSKQREFDMEVMMELPDYTTEFLVDSILSVAKALGKVPHALRRNGDLVTSELRSMTFAGVSGDVSFTSEGNRRDPRYEMFNLQILNGEPKWVNVGFAWTDLAFPELNSICFAALGCNRTSFPSDKYPAPAERVEVWVMVVIAVMLVLLIALLLTYWRSHRTQKDLESKIKAIDTELFGIDNNVKGAQQRRVDLLKQRAGLIQRPDSWSDSRDNLVEIFPTDPKYWEVYRTLQRDMDDAHLSKLWRIQNISLWTYYTFQRNRLEMHAADLNETHVWHGTSGTDPSVIYSDIQDGFMMQFSQSGYWGRGIYFAEKGSYSDMYAYKPSKGSKGVLPTDRPKAKEGEREMFLAKLLVGSDVFLNRDESAAKAAECTKLMMPPQVPGKTYRYNTVSGQTGESKVWVVYENGRAYPDYLVRYYRGSRDRKRTPFEDESEAMRKSRKFKKPAADIESASDIEVGNSPTVIWEFLGDISWVAYDDNHQIEIEASYQSFAITKASSTSKIQIKADMWGYEIDIASMTQRNISHSNHRERAIRRWTGDVSTRLGSDSDHPIT